MSGARSTPEALAKMEPSTRAGRSAKNRRRWCGGKVGRDHDYAVQVAPNNWGARRDEPCHETTWITGVTWWSCKHKAICQRCGRQEEITKEQCPDIGGSA